MSKPITGARGGYQMIDCKHQSIDDVGVTIAGIYDAIEGSLKPLMLVNLTIDGVDQTETMVSKSTVSTGFVMITGVNGDGEILTLTVTDEDVVTLVALAGGGDVEIVPVIKFTQDDAASGTWTSESTVDEIKAANDLVIMYSGVNHPIRVIGETTAKTVYMVGPELASAGSTSTIVAIDVKYDGTWRVVADLCEPHSTESVARKTKGGDK